MGNVTFKEMTVSQHTECHTASKGARIVPFVTKLMWIDWSVWPMGEEVI